MSFSVPVLVWQQFVYAVGDAVYTLDKYVAWLDVHGFHVSLPACCLYSCQDAGWVRKSRVEMIRAVKCLVWESYLASRFDQIFAVSFVSGVLFLGSGFDQPFYRLAFGPTYSSGMY